MSTTEIMNLLKTNIDYVLIGCGVLAFLFILFTIIMIINLIQTGKIRKKYKLFMEGKDGASLEEMISNHLDQIDGLVHANELNKQKIDKLSNQIKLAFQKVGLVKYDAFNEMGGKLSFSLALLNEKEDGFIINAMHSREGCYTYIKEIIAGNSVIMLSDEEKEALEMAKAYK